MNQPHRFTLQPYKTPSTRYTCPQCNRRKKFTRYIDLQTNCHLGDHVGKCDRADRCGYHYTPKQFFAANPHYELPNYQPYVPVPPPPVVTRPGTIAMASLRATLKAYGKNYFVQYLLNIFEEETVFRLIDDYFIGTAKRWRGSTVFWQVDRNHKVRTGKIMLYDAITGKRVKEPYSHITWVHRLVGKTGSQEVGKTGSREDGTDPPANHLSDLRGLSDSPSTYNLKQCFFGEHLLKEQPDAIVAIVESEKTAIIAAGFMPEYCWLAAGSLDGLTFEKCKVLQGREVILFPDADAFTKWEERMQQLRIRLPGIQFGMARYTDGLAQPEDLRGMDIADWLVGGRLVDL